jgi:hypothetical protein
VPVLPPDLARPFRDEAERGAARNLLARRDDMLRAIEELASTPAEKWSPDDYAAFPATTNGVPDPAPQRLVRWRSIFAEELDEVRELANRRPPLDDAQLRRALYYAGRLLATVTDLPIDFVDGFQLGGRVGC